MKKLLVLVVFLFSLGTTSLKAAVENIKTENIFIENVADFENVSFVATSSLNDVNFSFQLQERFLEPIFIKKDYFAYKKITDTQLILSQKTNTEYLNENKVSFNKKPVVIALHTSKEIKKDYKKTFYTFFECNFIIGKIASSKYFNTVNFNTKTLKSFSRHQVTSLFVLRNDFFVFKNVT